jgi:mono/diheme cytochrome c family protein
MRRAFLICLVAVGLAGVVAGCGSEGVTTPTPVTVVGTLPTAALEPATPAFALKGDPVAGKKTFLTAGCTGCHTLKDAGSTGTVGPNLDQSKPPATRVYMRVTQGGGAMPSFKGKLSTKQIADVIAYVTKATGGNPNG